MTNIIKKSTFLITLVLYAAIAAFGQPPAENIYSVSAWDGSNNINLCLRGGYTVSIDNKEIGHTYTLTQDRSKTLIQKFFKNRCNNSINLISPIVKTRAFSAFYVMDLTTQAKFIDMLIDDIVAQLKSY